ncbi:MAG: hypothetical protein JSS53_04205 [Proteobacteria bacterium]|nr:hypothetical protein [Pseudomonadota bacterium]
MSFTTVFLEIFHDEIKQAKIARRKTNGDALDLEKVFAKVELRYKAYVAEHPEVSDLPSEFDLKHLNNHSFTLHQLAQIVPVETEKQAQFFKTTFLDLTCSEGVLEAPLSNTLLMTDDKGLYPMHYAAMYGKPLLIDQMNVCLADRRFTNSLSGLVGQNLYDFPDAEGRTLLHTVAESEFITMDRKLEVLLELIVVHKADPKKLTKNGKDFSQMLGWIADTSGKRTKKLTFLKDFVKDMQPVVDVINQISNGAEPARLSVTAIDNLSKIESRNKEAFALLFRQFFTLQKSIKNVDGSVRTLLVLTKIQCFLTSSKTDIELAGNPQVVYLPFLDCLSAREINEYASNFDKCDQSFKESNIRSFREINLSSKMTSLSLYTEYRCYPVVVRTSDDLEWEEIKLEAIIETAIKEIEQYESQLKKMNKPIMTLADLAEYKLIQENLKVSLNVFVNCKAELVLVEIDSADVHERQSRYSQIAELLTRYGKDFKEREIKPLEDMLNQSILVRINNLLKNISSPAPSAARSNDVAATSNGIPVSQKPLDKAATEFAKYYLVKASFMEPAIVSDRAMVGFNKVGFIRTRVEIDGSEKPHFIDVLEEYQYLVDLLIVPKSESCLSASQYAELELYFNNIVAGDNIESHKKLIKALVMPFYADIQSTGKKERSSEKKAFPRYFTDRTISLLNQVLVKNMPLMEMIAESVCEDYRRRPVNHQTIEYREFIENIKSIFLRMLSYRFETPDVLSNLARIYYEEEQCQNALFYFRAAWQLVKRNSTEDFQSSGQVMFSQELDNLNRLPSNLAAKSRKNATAKIEEEVQRTKQNSEDKMRRGIAAIQQVNKFLVFVRMQYALKLIQLQGTVSKDRIFAPSGTTPYDHASLEYALPTEDVFTKENFSPFTAAYGLMLCAVSNYPSFEPWMNPGDEYSEETIEQFIENLTELRIYIPADPEKSLLERGYRELIYDKLGKCHNDFAWPHNMLGQLYEVLGIPGFIEEYEIAAGLREITTISGELKMLKPCPEGLINLARQHELGIGELKKIDLLEALRLYYEAWLLDPEHPLVIKVAVGRIRLLSTPAKAASMSLPETTLAKIYLQSLTEEQEPQQREEEKSEHGEEEKSEHGEEEESEHGEEEKSEHGEEEESEQREVEELGQKKKGELIKLRDFVLEASFNVQLVLDYVNSVLHGSRVIAMLNPLNRLPVEKIYVLLHYLPKQEEPIQADIAQLMQDIEKEYPRLIASLKDMFAALAPREETVPSVDLMPHGSILGLTFQEGPGVSLFEVALAAGMLVGATSLRDYRSSISGYVGDPINGEELDDLFLPLGCTTWQRYVDAIEDEETDIPANLHDLTIQILMKMTGKKIAVIGSDGQTQELNGLRKTDTVEKALQSGASEADAMDECPGYVFLCRDDKGLYGRYIVNNNFRAEVIYDALTKKDDVAFSAEDLNDHASSSASLAKHASKRGYFQSKEENGSETSSNSNREDQSNGHKEDEEYLSDSGSNRSRSHSASSRSGSE